jgi:hypothetical protein
MTRSTNPINLAIPKMPVEDAAQLQSWRGLTGLLEESYLAEQQERLIQGGNPNTSIAVRRNFTVPAALGDSRFGRSLASQGGRDSPLSAIFDFDLSSSHRSPLRTSRRSNGPSSSRNPSSIPTTPLRDSFPDGAQHPRDGSGLHHQHPGHRTSILTSPMRDSRYRTPESSASPSRQASEATIRPLRYGTDAISIKAPQTQAVIDNVLSMSPPAIDNGYVPSAEQTIDRMRRDGVESLPGLDTDRLDKAFVGERTKPAIRISTERLDADVTDLPAKPDWTKPMREVLRLSIPQQQILKCSIAYLIASLFTFVPAFSNLLSTDDAQGRVDVHGRVIRQPAYSAHMVATIVCYVRRNHFSCRSSMLTLDDLSFIRLALQAV